MKLTDYFALYNFYFISIWRHRKTSCEYKLDKIGSAINDFWGTTGANEEGPILETRKRTSHIP